MIGSFGETVLEALVVDLLHLGGGKRLIAAMLDPLNKIVNIEPMARQQPQQRAYRVDDLAIGAAREHPKQQHDLWYYAVEFLTHSADIAPDDCTTCI